MTKKSTISPLTISKLIRDNKWTSAVGLKLWSEKALNALNSFWTAIREARDAEHKSPSREYLTPYADDILENSFERDLDGEIFFNSRYQLNLGWMIHNMQFFILKRTHGWTLSDWCKNLFSRDDEDTGIRTKAINDWLGIGRSEKMKSETLVENVTVGEGWFLTEWLKVLESDQNSSPAGFMINNYFTKEYVSEMVGEPRSSEEIEARAAAFTQGIRAGMKFRFGIRGMKDRAIHYFETTTTGSTYESCMTKAWKEVAKHCKLLWYQNKNTQEFQVVNMTRVA